MPIAQQFKVPDKDEILLKHILVGLVLLFFSVVAEHCLAQVVAYRGGGQLVDYERLEKTGCYAESIVSSENKHIENTIEAVASSIAFGAQIIHLNIQVSLDGQIVLFHDNALDCSTDGLGKVSKYNYAALAEFDAGYDYTYGESGVYPFRGSGYKIGLLEDVTSKYPHISFWLNIKSNGLDAFGVVQAFIAEKFATKMNRVLLIANTRGRDFFKTHAPHIAVISANSTEFCLPSYMLDQSLGFPSECVGAPVLIPPSILSELKGWPM